MRRRLWQKLAALSWRERLGLLEAAAALAFTSAALHLSGYRRTQELLARLAGKPHSTHAGRHALDRQADAIIWRVGAVAHYAPLTPTCLTQSLTIWWLLRRTGIDSEICIGAAKSGQILQAHAWVERNGEVLNDSPDVRQKYGVFAK